MMRIHTPTATTPPNTHHERAHRNLTTVERCAVGLLAIALILAAAGALSPTVEVPFSPVRIDEGQTLWRLAQDHPIEGLTTAQTVEVIEERNRLSTGSLQAGMTVQVPSGRSSSAVAMR